MNLFEAISFYGHTKKVRRMQGDASSESFLGERKVSPLLIGRATRRVLKTTCLVLLLLCASRAFAAESAIPSAWELIDRFKDVSLGDWVKLKYSGGSEHLLLAAAKDKDSITLEERVREQGYLTSWTQTVIDLKKKTPVTFRERLPDGVIRELQLDSKQAALDEDFQALLTAKFEEEPGTEVVIVPAGRFSCNIYRAVYNKKLIRVFFSPKVPLYPVKVLIPNYQLTIRLDTFGKEMVSRFFPDGQKPAAPDPAKPSEEQPPVREEGCVN
jgi:hypothetical protein